MAGINSVTLVGRVGQDPEYRKFLNGGEVIEFSMATSETWKDKNSGERKEKTQWHRVKVFNENAIKVVRDYVSKGSMVGVEGALEYSEWEKDGQKHKSAEVVIKPFYGKLHLMGSKDDNTSRGGEGRGGDSGSRGGDDSGDRGRQDQRGNFTRDMDDDIPF